MNTDRTKWIYARYTMAVCMSMYLLTPQAQRKQVIPALSKNWNYTYNADPRFVKMASMPSGPFIRLDAGTILSAGGGVQRGDLLISTDNGRTWYSKMIIEDTAQVQNSSAQVIQRKENGTVVMAFCNNKELKWPYSSRTRDAVGATYPTYVVRSTDNGRTWRKPVKLHDAWTGYNTSMIITSKGYFVFTSMMIRNNPLRHVAITYTSKDDGETWQRSNSIDLGGMGHHDGAMEATLVELKDGRLMKLIRTNWNQFWRAESVDDGLTWNLMGPSGIPASASHGQLLRLKSGRLLLAWNRPYRGDETILADVVGGDRIWSATPGSNHRNELSVAFSDDDGISWSKPIIAATTVQQQGGTSRALEKGHIRPNEISYPYLFEFEKGRIWITSSRGPLRASFKEADLISVNQ